MDRQDAIDTFGHYYSIEYHHPSGRKAIVERLGRTHSINYQSPEEAAAGYDARLRASGKYRAERAKVFLEGPVNFVARWMARVGLHPDGYAVLSKYYRHLEDLRRGLEDVKFGYSDPIMKIIRLPEQVKMPHAIQPGQRLYWINTHKLLAGKGVEAEPLTVTGRELQPGFGNPYDYKFLYTARRGHEKPLLFDYNHDSLSTGEVDTDSTGTRYFITLETAEKAALEMLGTLTNRFNAQAKDIRAARHERILAKSAAHYALDL